MLLMYLLEVPLAPAPVITDSRLSCIDDISLEVTESVGATD